MSMYNMMNGVNPATFLILPMLGKHPDEYPRFRDCFVDDGKIAVFTRVGGNNRNEGYGEEKLYEDPNFISTEDWNEDNTYAYYYFKVPEKWQNDFNSIMNGKTPSDEYINEMKRVYPKLAEKFDNMFKNDNK